MQNSEDWTNNPSVRMISSCRPEKKFLVFLVPKADQRSPLLGLRREHRNFDIAVRFYEHPGMNLDLVTEADFVMTGGLSKFHSAAQFLRDLELQHAYDGYLFLDGDLEFDGGQLSAFLSFVHAAGLDLAQPSLTHDSYCYWKMAYHQAGYVFRQTSFVEVMAPYLSRNALNKALPTFSRSISTYGLDLVWPSLIGTDAIGVIDAFQIRHRDVVNHATGKFYQYLKSIGVDLDEEERRMLREYGVTVEEAHSRRGYFWGPLWPHSRRTVELVSVPLGRPERYIKWRSMINLAMYLARRGRARAEKDLANAIGPFLSSSHVSPTLRRSTT